MKLKTAMHVHSTWSYDGRWTLEHIAQAFMRRGYQILLMTEHDQGFTEDRRQAYWDACRKASNERLLIVPGIEYSDPSNTIHLLVWGDIPFLGTGQSTLTILEKAKAQGGVCVLAHPSRRSAWKLFQPEWLKHLAGIELWNRKTDGWAASPDAIKLARQTGAQVFVGLDFHSPKQFFPMALSLEMDGLPNQAKILTSLMSGSYHCEVFGLNVNAFTGPLCGSLNRSIEAGRRLAAYCFRFIASRLPKSAPRGSRQNIRPGNPPPSSNDPSQK